MSFSNRLKNLRNEKGLSQKDLAFILGFAQETYSSWERGRTEPDFEVLKRLAKYFDVTTDYLLGLTNNIYARND